MIMGRNRASDFGGELVVHERGKGSGTGASGERQGEYNKRKGILYP